MAGYSGTPLARKLGYKPGFRAHVRNAPPNYPDLVGELPSGTRMLKRLSDELDLIHVFVETRADLQRAIATCRPRLRSTGALWISWPKKASGRQRDANEDTVRELALPTGLVDVKVCAVDATWSALKLVIRKSQRSGQSRGAP